ncbi:MAG: hypothetical protein F4148_04730 [Caldilineaceae bacterium SB0675_bin_29]|uniref:Uncharacterized protein n=1 Tax=Caldilineaceae bacterium SB0675_bin_29 TaxID=2605266 RepID=A0A6B1FTX1_9CHLR|nr:hypothetical protein [Caldilineaceae bacterium SB0675_bin_29]
MSGRDWQTMGWAWVAGGTLLGLGILLGAGFRIDSIFAFDTGLGTALLLVAGVTLFAVALPALITTDNKLVSTAGIVTAIFGYGGTSIILFDEDPILFALVWVYHFYLVFFAFVLAVTSRWIRGIFTRLRS